MRKSICLLTLLPFLVLAQRTSEELAAEDLKKYELEKGTISYDITGGASGQEVFVFDRFGWRSLKKRSMNFELYGEDRSQEQHEVSDGKIVYRIDHKDSTYRKRIDIRWSTLAKQMSPSQASESMLFSLGGSYAGDSTLLGKTCQVWTFESKSLQEMWVWKGLVLKRKSKLSDLDVATTATSIDLQGTIDEVLFRLPEVYVLKE